jgi:hypothetical protein
MGGQGPHSSGPLIYDPHHHRVMVGGPFTHHGEMIEHIVGAPTEFPHHEYPEYEYGQRRGDKATWYSPGFEGEEDVNQHLGIEPVDYDQWDFHSKVATTRSLYHGTLIDHLPHIQEHGLQPQVGDFVSDAYGDYTDPEEQEELGMRPTVFMTDKSRLNKALNAIQHNVGVKLNKGFGAVTPQDIQEHGLLVKQPGQMHEPENVAPYHHVFDDNVEEGHDPWDNDPSNRQEGEHPYQAEPGDFYSEDPVRGNLQFIHGPAMMRVFKSRGLVPQGRNPDNWKFDQPGFGRDRNPLKAIQENAENQAEQENEQHYGAGSHQLNWDLGQWGKGFMSHGNIHTWNTDQADGYPTHSEYAEDTGIDQHQIGVPFEIHPEGIVRTFSGAPHDSPEIFQVDPRLRPEPRGEQGEYEWHFSRVAKNEQNWQLVKEAMPVGEDYWNEWQERAPFKRAGELYHGTSPARLESIMQHGLHPWDSPLAGGSNYGQPREDEDDWNPNPSQWLVPRPGHVYMAQNPKDARDRGVDSSVEDLGPHTEPLVLKIDPSYLDPQHINPDEDNMIPKATISPQEGYDSLGEMADRMGYGDVPSETERQLAQGKHIGYRGVIPPEALTPGVMRAGAWEPLAAQQRAASWSIRGDKLHDFLMDPKSRPDLQTPEAHAFLKDLSFKYHNDKTDKLMPWLTREWKKKRLDYNPNANPKFGYRANGTFQGLGSTQLDHWGDFLKANHPLRRELGDIMQHPIHEFAGRVHAWDEDMERQAEEASAGEAAKGGKVVHEWPDKWTVRQLHTPQELEAEGDAMGHCVGSYHDEVGKGKTMIYSLRDPEGKPHVTTEIVPSQHEWIDSSGNSHRSPHKTTGDASGTGMLGFATSHPIPHQGEVEQIQGKANREPNDEYKRRMKDWFETFPEEERPHAVAEDDYLSDPADIEDKHYRPDAPNEYGLRQAPATVEWPEMLNHMVRDTDQRYYHGEHYADEIYDLAKARHEIPQMGKEYEEYRRDQQNDLDNLAEQNHEWMWENTGPHPFDIQNVDEAQQYGYHGTYDEMSPEQRAQAEETYEQRQADAERELAREHPGTQAANALGERLTPHYNPQEDEYQNEPYQEQKESQADWQVQQ